MGELREQATTIAPKYGLDGYITQFDRYEGFTVNLREAIWDVEEEGKVLGADTCRPCVQRGGGTQPAPGRRALFMCNWTYAHQLLNAPDSTARPSTGTRPCSARTATCRSFTTASVERPRRRSLLEHCLG